MGGVGKKWAVALALLAGAAACLAAGPAAAPRAPRNVLLITVDTLRVDHLSAYGYPFDTSRTLRTLADAGVLFEDVTAQIPVTGPGHCTILTSLYPQTHGSYRNGVRMNGKAVTLADVLKARGFHTAAFVSSWTLRSSLTGLDGGFDVYDQESTDRYGVVNSQRFANEVTDRAVSWIERLDDGPFFLWVHYFDPHEPYRLVAGFEDPGPAPGQREEDLPSRPREIVRYDSEISFADAHMARVLNALARRGWFDDTLVVYTADHGEAFGEHGYRGHGRRVHQPGVAVPLVFRWPAGLAKARRVDQPVASVDIMPTVLEVLGLEPPAVLQGESLAAWLRPGPLPPARARDIYSVAYPGAVGHMPRFVRKMFARKKPDLPIQMALRTGPWKYVLQPGPGRARLYDLGRDPREIKDLLRERGEFRSYQVRLVEWFERTRQEEGKMTLTADDIRKLETLGYVGTAADTSDDEEEEDEAAKGASAPHPGR